MPAERFLAAPALAMLKAFQRRTVDYVFDRLYGTDDPVRQFLVADEVGLGKTMVARRSSDLRQARGRTRRLRRQAL